MDSEGLCKQSCHYPEGQGGNVNTLATSGGGAVWTILFLGEADLCFVSIHVNVVIKYIIRTSLF